ncbi:hypothetical protein FKP32DRAFT_833900 [Trametes sanguinea]|nr:hypothetical protein FKP32DRAFT_833900 [Trametes sanguinea]
MLCTLDGRLCSYGPCGGTFDMQASVMPLPCLEEILVVFFPRQAPFIPSERSRPCSCDIGEALAGLPNHADSTNDLTRPSASPLGRNPPGLGVFRPPCGFLTDVPVPVLRQLVQSGQILPRLEGIILGRSRLAMLHPTLWIPSWRPCSCSRDVGEVVAGIFKRVDPTDGLLDQGSSFLGRKPSSWDAMHHLLCGSFLA